MKNPGGFEGIERDSFLTLSWLSLLLEIALNPGGGPIWAILKLVPLIGGIALARAYS